MGEVRALPGKPGGVFVVSIYDETIFEIWRMREKRSYYLMSAAGAGIGYTLATIQPDITVSETRLVLASLLAWALSFFSGHFAVSNLKTVVGFFISTPEKLNDSRSQGPDAEANLVNTINEFSDYLFVRTKLFNTAQILLLALGAILLVSTRLNIPAAIGVAQ